LPGSQPAEQFRCTRHSVIIELINQMVRLLAGRGHVSKRKRDD
jgi:hypothetical protein